jgi:hypothetical protein
MDVPSKMSIPTVALSSLDNTKVAITWVQPSIHGSSISEYEILFRKSDGTFAEETTNCDASIALIRDAFTCEVPMLTVLALTSQTVDALI